MYSASDTKRGPEKERPIIREDPEKALARLLKPKKPATAHNQSARTDRALHWRHPER